MITYAFCERIAAFGPKYESDPIWNVQKKQKRRNQTHTKKQLETCRCRRIACAHDAHTHFAIDRLRVKTLRDHSVMMLITFALHRAHTSFSFTFTGSPSTTRYNTDRPTIIISKYDYTAVSKTLHACTYYLTCNYDVHTCANMWNIYIYSRVASKFPPNMKIHQDHQWSVFQNVCYHSDELKPLILLRVREKQTFLHASSIGYILSSAYNSREREKPPRVVFKTAQMK